MGGGEGAVGGYARPRLLLFLVQRPPWGTPYHHGEDFGSPDRALEETCYGGMESRGVCEASRYTASLIEINWGLENLNSFDFTNLNLISVGRRSLGCHCVICAFAMCRGCGHPDLARLIGEERQRRQIVKHCSMN